MQILAVVSLGHVSGKPEDRMNNTFAFEYPGPDVPATDSAIVTALINFYNQTPSGGTKAVAKHINDSISRATNGCYIALYSINEHLDGSPHGSPLGYYGFTLISAEMAGAGLPAEAAICLSFHAAYGLLSEEVGSQRPKQRRRGRVYIGPLTQLVLDQDATTKRTRVLTSVVTNLTKAGEALMNDSNTNWCVWSRKDQLTLSVVGGFVDDAFDTHRSRGERAVTRQQYGA